MATSEKRGQGRSRRAARASVVLALAACVSISCLRQAAAQPGGDLPDLPPVEAPHTNVPRVDSFKGPKVPAQPQPQSMRPVPPPPSATPKVTILDVEPIAPAEPPSPAPPKANDVWLPPDRPRTLPPVPTAIESPRPVPQALPSAGNLPPAVQSPWAHEPVPNLRLVQPPAAPAPLIAPPPEYGKVEPVKTADDPGHPWEAHTPLGWLFGHVFESVCTPYADYQPRWRPLADSAFFVEGVRPQSQVRVRWDGGFNTNVPDRAEFFWGRADGKGHGPNATLFAPRQGAVAPRGETFLTYHDFSVYGETVFGNTSVFFEAPYRVLYPDEAPDANGFGDVNLGTKTLLLDCDLFQIGFLFRVYAPAGSASRGLGTGHASLEPALLLSVKLTSDLYFQGELAEWIPVGGDPDYMGTVFHYHFSLNHVLCRIAPSIPVVGTFEFNGWTFQGGQFTDPVLGPSQHAGGSTSLSVGPGVRVHLYEWLDFGVGSEVSLTEKHFADRLLRTEFRLRF